MDPVEEMIDMEERKMIDTEEMKKDTDLREGLREIQEKMIR